MKKETIEIKSKGEVVGAQDYSYPETLKEAIQVDGEDTVFKLYAQQRRIRFADQQRRALTGGGGLPKGLRDALKNADPAKLKEIEKLLGVQFS
jgi:hypothetical protein